MNWESKAAAKRKQRDDALLKISAFATPLGGNETEISVDGSDDAANLVRKMACGEVTAEAVTLAYIQRAVTAHQDTNCLSEPMFQEALNRARSLDSYFKENGKIVGPLHGVPMSVKDQFNVKGFDSTIGYVGRCDKPASQDSAMVSILTRLGAIIITKTTVPQSIMWSETDSPLWGATTYPGRPELTPGGSSGGEATLGAMSGAVCGWGTDLGGSIRAPSHLCGLFGLRPSHSRFPYAGAVNSQEGQGYAPSSVGPMSSHLSTLIDVCKACLDAKPWTMDPKVVPLSWRNNDFVEVQDRNLRIGVILDDGMVRPHPEVELAVQRTASLFQEAGHEIVPWDASRHKSIIEIMDQFYRADGGEDIRTAVNAGGEPLLPAIARLVDSAQPISVYEYWQLKRKKEITQQAYHDQWNASGCTNGCHETVDVIISPVMPHTAVPHSMCRWVGYNKIWNFLDYTAISFPFGHFRHEQSQKSSPDHLCASDGQEAYQKHYTPRNDLDEWNQKLYDPETMDGLPIGVQIIGRRFEEEKVLGIAKVLEGLLREKQNRS